MSVVIETTLGDITVDLYLEQRPRTCLNFLKLCKVKYYNLCVFHKVERNFIAQNGDPSQTGRGGESIFCHLYGEQAKYFDIELKPKLKHEKLGTLSMVNNGNNMNGSQFFITLGENLTYLDEVHTVFGEVAEGFETLLKINEAICDPNDRPYQDIRITHTVILHDPYEDPSELEIPPTSPVPTKEQLQSNYIGADEEIDDTKGKSMEEIEEKIKDSEAKARATILEMVGDIPDADVRPPENVLFVCKLNPVTTSEDLEVIFSRFGAIVSCEVIKDRKTGESLQYAFIEFENEKDCESAYFKMDNVLIDDRRIHVDFSQSVSKMNFDDKFQRFQSQRKETLVLKDKVKRQSDYSMVFDIDDKEPPSRHSDKYKSLASSDRHSNHTRERKNHGSKVKSSYDKYSRKEYSSHRSRAIEDHTIKSSSKKVQETSSKHRDDKFYSSHTSSRNSNLHSSKGNRDSKEAKHRYSSDSNSSDSSMESSHQKKFKKVKNIESRVSSYSNRFTVTKSPERKMQKSESRSSKAETSHSLKQYSLSQKKISERKRQSSTSSESSSNSSSSSSHQSDKNSKHRSSVSQSQQTQHYKQKVEGKHRREKEKEESRSKHKYYDSSVIVSGDCQRRKR